jgi:hypothetical protein
MAMRIILGTLVATFVVILIGATNLRPLRRLRRFRNGSALADHALDHGAGPHPLDPDARGRDCGSVRPRQPGPDRIS